MKMKMMLAAGALALAVTGQASATAIVNGNSFANNLVLSVWDQTNNTSYTANLGTTMQDLLNGYTFGGTAKAPVVSGSSTAGSFSFSDAALTSFLATADMTNTSWSVVGVNMGITGYGTAGSMFTAAAGAPLSAVTTATLNASQGLNGNYIATVNGLNGSNLATTNSYTTTASTGGLAYVGGFSNGMGNSMGGSLPFLDSASVGTSQNFYFMTPTQNARSVYAGATGFAFGNTAGTSTFTLGSNGTLTYAVAAVPEPGEWLLMLSGLCLVGFIATRRKQGSMTFA